MTIPPQQCIQTHIVCVQKNTHTNFMNSTLQLSQTVWPLLMFTLFSCSTPGPNNLLLTLSGSQFGFRKTLPFILGIRVGVVLLFLLMGAGTGALMLSYPNGYQALKLVGAGYLIFLAGKLLLCSSSQVPPNQAKLLGFSQGLLLQFVNPKSIVMVLSCVSAFSIAGDLYLFSVLQATLIFTLVGALCNCAWVLFGVTINQLLTSVAARQRFNQVLAMLTLVTVGILFYQ
jgi:threonine/homoserine/homoserine lactone efflux protein